MQRPSHTAKSASTKSARPQLRAQSCVHLCSGDTVGAFIECAHSFEDTPVVFNKWNKDSSLKASDWVADKIQDVAAMCAIMDFTERPLVLPIPTCALIDVNTLEACINATAQTRLCNQELSLELTDAAITAHPEEAQAFMHAFRRKGFRVSIDARKSWASELPAPCWLLVDTLRIRASELETGTSLETLIDPASSAGVAIVAERPYWRDGEYLARQGIDYALSPRADA